MIFSGTSNPELAEEISNYLEMPLSKAVINRFSDGEINIKIAESVRGKDVFIIQPTSAPANSNLMELLIMTDALKRSSAKSITAVVPYYGYARQDRKAAPRVPITAKVGSKPYGDIWHHTYGNSRSSCLTNTRFL